MRLWRSIERGNSAARASPWEHRVHAPSPQEINVQGKLEMRIDLNFPNPTSLTVLLDYIRQSTRGPNDAGLPIEVDLYGRNIYGGNIALSSVRRTPRTASCPST